MADQKDASAPSGSSGSSAAAAETPAKEKKQVNYGVFTLIELDLSSPGAQKSAGEQLAKFATDGKLAVLARLGRSVTTGPKQALIELSASRELDGDYEVIAESSRNKFDKVKTELKPTLSIG